MEKPKKVFLDAPAEYDFDLIGMVSSLKSYVLASRLNKRLSLDFVRSNNLETINKKDNGVSEFAVYEFNDDNLFITYRLFQNKSKGVLLPQYKNLDFFLCIAGDLKPSDLKVFAARFLEIDGIQYSMLIDTENLKGKEWLMF